MNIPAPSQQYDSYNNYSYSGLRQNWANDTGPDYGMGGYGYDPAAVEAYKRELAAYIQRAQAELSTLQAGSPEYQQDMFYLQQAYQYAEQVGLQVQGTPGIGNEFDPLAASANAGYGITPSYQDPNKVIYEDILPAMTADKNNLKEEHFYAPPYDFTVPGSATANVTSEVDPNNPDKTRICVTVTWPDGKVKRHYFYNVDWKENALILRSTAPDHQFNLDASVTENKNIKMAEIGEVVKTEEEIAAEAEEEKELTAVNPEALSDTPPSILSEDGKKAIYNKESDPTITVYPNGPTTNEIQASGIFTLNAYRQSDRFVVKEEGENLIITVTTTNDKGEEKTITYTVNKNQIDKIVIGNIDDTQIDLRGVTSEEARAKFVNSTETPIQETPEQAPEFVLSKLESMGVDIEAFLQNYYEGMGPQADTNHDGKIDIDEFKVALKDDNFLPTDLNALGTDGKLTLFGQLTTILLMSDPTLKNLLESIKNSEGKLSPAEFQRIGVSITARMCELLQVLYQGKGIEIHPSNTTGNPAQAFQISFNGQTTTSLPPIFIALMAMAHLDNDKGDSNE